MAAVTICSDFGAQKSKVCHCFHCFSIYLPWSNGTDAMIFVFWILSFNKLGVTAITIIYFIRLKLLIHDLPGSCYALFNWSYTFLFFWNKCIFKFSGFVWKFLFMQNWITRFLIREISVSCPCYWYVKGW